MEGEGEADCPLIPFPSARSYEAATDSEIVSCNFQLLLILRSFTKKCSNEHWLISGSGTSCDECFCLIS